MQLQKITKRTYDDACGTAHALEIVGERWALLVMRELFWGPKRFSDLRSSLPGISANVLTQRLASLEATGVIIRRRLPPPVSAQAYELTPWGYESEPIFQVLGRWAARSPTHDPTLPLSVSSLMMSFRTMFDAGRAGDLRMVIGFEIGHEQFRAQIEDGGIEIARGEAPDADVVFTAPAEAIAGVVYAGLPVSMLQVDGDPALAARFVTLFPLPPKVA